MPLDRAFAHPWLLWLLAVPPVLSVLALLARRRRRKALARLGRVSTLAALTARRPFMLFLQAGCRTLGLPLLVLAAAGPQWGRDPLAVTAPGRDLVVVLDLSRSMLADDAVGVLSANRLGRACDGLMELANTVQKTGGHRLGLVVFAARPRVVCPLTHDYDHFRDAVAGLSPDDPRIAVAPGSEPPPSGTRIGAGLSLAVRLHDVDAQGFQDILLISDGDDPAGDQEWRRGIAVARDSRIPVYTVGVGDPDQGARIPLVHGYLRHAGKEIWTRLQESPLQDIAARTGGLYTGARTDALPLAKLFAEQMEPRGGRESRDDEIAPYQQHSGLFFGAALFFLALELSVPSGGAGARNRSPCRFR